MNEASSNPEIPARRTQSPQSVTRVIRILEALCAAARPLTLAELSRALATPKSSLAALLRGLADEDFVVQAEGAWRLGAGAFGLGSALSEARRQLQSSDVVRDGLRRLAARSGETVLFAVGDQEDAMLTYVDIIESRNSVRFAAGFGDRRPLYPTAGGRALLATWPEEALKAYLRTIQPERFAERTDTDPQVIARAVAEARATGVAQTVDQAGDGVTGSASVIRDASGAVIGALVLAAPSSRSQDRLAELACMVRDEAEAISRNLGYRQGDRA